jgi:hypothetical protein
MSSRLEHTPLRLLTGIVLSVSALLCAPQAHAVLVGTVYASGLNNPRGLSFGPDGGLYIAEAGLDQGGTPTAPTFTSTGSIMQVLNGVQTRVETGLASVKGMEVSGPNDVSFDNAGTRYVTIGAGLNPNDRPPGSHLATLQSAGSTLANLGDYEASVNPAGGPFDSNPWRAVAIDGGMLVTDAGANALLKVAADGTVTTVLALTSDVTGFAADAVPTGLAVGPDEAYYVGMLTGFPFTPGASDVLRVLPDGTYTRFATGFTNVTDIAFGADGSLYVLEFDADGMMGGASTGALLQVAADGSTWTEIYGGLIAPAGLAIGPDGAFYITGFSETGDGQVLRIAEVPEPPTVMLLGLGVLLVAGLARQRRRTRSRSEHA